MPGFCQGTGVQATFVNAVWHVITRRFNSFALPDRIGMFESTPAFL